MTIPPLTGGPQPRKSGWSIVEMSNSGHTRNFAHSENTFCCMSYHNLVIIKPCVLITFDIIAEIVRIVMTFYLYSHPLFITLCTCNDPDSRAKIP